VTFDEFQRSFTTPPMAYRPAPFFVFNDEHEGEAGEPRITEVLEGLARTGFGGAFLHPRPGLITEYLSPRWFELIRHSVRECLRLGLVPYLYDENSYPSGVGGGHVPARVPEAHTQYVTMVSGAGPDHVPANALAVHLLDADDPGAPIDAGAVPVGRRWLAFVLRPMDPLPWHGETACPSLLDPRTATAFLESTYDAYRQAMGGELWAALPAIFTDEPHLPAGGHGPWGLGLHLTPYVLGQFRQRLGYGLEPHLASLYFDVGEFRRVRYDFYDLAHRLWLENWALPLERWCDENGIALTGHYLEHDWPSPYATPGHVHLLAHMHWPGTDVLETFLLRGHEFYDIQNLDPAPDGAEPHALMYFRQCQSVAHQLGKERVLCEAWGAGGHDSTPADWARIGRWMIAHGVNLVVPHLSFLTIRGTRKTDHPQTFTDHSPWFEHLRPLTDELARLCWAASQGQARQRVLVLDPLTSGFCVSRKSDGAQPMLAGEFGSRGDVFSRSLASVHQLGRAFDLLAQALSDEQVDFDIGDEYVIEESGGVEAGTLRIGGQAYELLVWPEHMTNLRTSTAATLERFLEQGGAVAGVRPPELTVDGRPSRLLEDWDRRYAGACTWVACRYDLVRAVTELVRPRLRLLTPPATGLAHLRREHPDFEVFLVVNSSSVQARSEALLDTARSRVYELDPGRGTWHRLSSSAEADGRRVSLEIPPAGATVLLTSDREVAAEPRPPAAVPRGPATRLRLRSATRTEPNVLLVDACELQIGDQTHGPVAVYEANRRLWRAHGLATNGWMGVIQFRDQVLARNATMAASSGGVVRYRFDIEEGVDLDGLRLALETPELWRISVNGRHVDAEHGERWLDPRIRAFGMGRHLTRGENLVELEGRPFDVRREIDQIYLLGEIACLPDDPGFRVAPASPLGLGSWKEQGCPFYDREVAYELDLPAGAGPGVLAFDDAGWHGSLLLVELDGRLVAQLMEPPWEARLDAGGAATLTVRVVGLPKNLLGPLHHRDRPRGTAGPPMWFGRNVSSEPQPGAEYDLIDLGLFQEPTWTPVRPEPDR
jgi:hypothetical protein